MKHIQTITVGAGGAASIDFTSIPQTYTDLVLKVSSRTNRTTATFDDLPIALNGSFNATIRVLYGLGSSVGSYSSSGSSSSYAGLATSSDGSTASVFGSAEIYIPNYTSVSSHSISVDGTSENNGTSTGLGLTTILWSGTSAAVTSLTLEPGDGTLFKQYSSASLYGIKNS